MGFELNTKPEVNYSRKLRKGHAKFAQDDSDYVYSEAILLCTGTIFKKLVVNELLI